MECAVLEDEVRQGVFAAVYVDVPAVILERAVDKLEIVQNGAPAGPGARGIPPPRRICGCQLNPHRELIVGADEGYVLETQVFNGRGGAIPDGQRGGVAVIHKSFHHEIFDSPGRAGAIAAGSASATVKSKSVVHGHREPVFNQDVTAAAEVISIVMVLVLAVDDLDVTHERFRGSASAQPRYR
jgi:hypothetical protein